MKITSVEDIAKIIATNWADWRSFIGKARKVIEYLKSKREEDLFL